MRTAAYAAFSGNAPNLWDGNRRRAEDDDIKLMRFEADPFVADEGHDQTLIDSAEALARQWLKDRSGVEPEIVEPVLQTAAQFGDRDLWDLIHQQALARKNTALRKS